MDDFTIITRFTKSDYTRFLYREIYKKPLIILATLVGLYLFVTSVLSYFQIENPYTKDPFFDLVLGIIILLGPTIMVFIAAKGYMSNPSLQHDVEYTFNNDGVNVQGLTFKSELMWAHIIKLKETKKFLILLSSKRLGNFIDKSKLTPEQIQFIKSKVPVK
jgi:hypothetical protein